MTDREALIILTAGFAQQNRDHDIAIEEAIAALAMIDDHLASRKTEHEETDPLKRYPWAIDTDGDGGIRDKRRKEVAIVMSSIAKPGKWMSWRTPHNNIDDDIHDTRDEAIACVDWAAWDRMSQ